MQKTVQTQQNMAKGSGFSSHFSIDRMFGSETTQPDFLARIHTELKET